MTTKQTHLFYENSYKIQSGNSMVIQTRGFNSLPVTVAMIALGILVLWLSVVFSYKLVLLGIPLVVWPFVSDQWRFPKTINFDLSQQSVQLSRFGKVVNRIEFSRIQEIGVDAQILTTDVSPFKEGFREYGYSFYVLDDKGKKWRLFRLRFRDEKDEEMKGIIHFLNNHLGD